VDSSEGSDLAVAWAAEEAQSRRAPLTVLSSYHWSLMAEPWETFEDRQTVADFERSAQRVVDRAMARARVQCPGLEVTGAVADALPQAALVERSAQAALLVVGSRRMGRLGAALLGSVGSAVAAHAACPAVVLRGPAGEPAEGAGVVVGIDARQDCETILAFALEHADRHGLPLRAIMCWHPDPLAVMKWRPEQPPPAEAQAWLAESVAGWREKYPTVTIDSAVVRAHPTAGLVAEATSQHLLVVGTHSRHALAGTLLGSVSQGVLYHATCPVVVVPTSPR
jgi:nucleotide-binding universal stress UspA family protein